jgi:hypothetical protein
MSLDTLHSSLKKIEAVLRAATPESLYERDADRMGWLIHVAEDYLEEALADLDAEMHEGTSPCR